MTFSFDSSSLVRYNREMPIDIFESVWQWLADLANDGDMLVAEEVLIELRDGHPGDPVLKWISDRPEIIVPSGEVQEEAALIINNYQIIEPDSTKNQADPWVVAVAQAREAGVVGNERYRRGKSPRDRIPDVCVDLGINYFMHHDFMRHHGKKF